ncbi:RsbRD N-terminal domain-containing protein [Desulfobulbus sp. US2]|nr:RsbRD N-terminal domain-containing protein [Desulfobulbus sp. US4]MCW5207205.1 RsbRD N-terminal domain-containing protein [Desulfobulbus sp. US2]WLE95636.1 MAG: RsbRD N-terminal domain-containing protein [Candidatus Electrothrix communis]
MNLLELLQKKEKKILDIWVERTLDSYISSDFFKQAKDPFANPVGANIRAGLTTIFQLILAEAEHQDFAEPLDQVIRIRAVQEFTPAQAVAPILELKWVVKQVFSADEKGRSLLSELAPFDRDVDRVTLMAFDMYMNCRDGLHQARIRELKSGSYILTDSSCASAAVRENLQDIASLSKE